MADVRSADEQTLADARRIIADGGLVVIPTDTVYGIACDPCNAAAIARIYAAKHRPADKALQVIMPDLSVLPKLGLALPTPLDALARRFLWLMTIRRCSRCVSTIPARVPKAFESPIPR